MTKPLPWDSTRASQGGNRSHCVVLRNHIWSDPPLASHQLDAGWVDIPGKGLRSSCDGRAVLSKQSSPPQTPSHIYARTCRTFSHSLRPNTKVALHQVLRLDGFSLLTITLTLTLLELGLKNSKDAAFSS